MACDSDSLSMLSPAACHQARALLGISEAELARLAGISVARFERGDAARNHYAAKKILEALAREKILFIGGSAKFGR